MRQLIPFRFAAHALLWLFAAMVIFQLAVLLGLVPTEMVWGGRLRNDAERTIGAIVSMGVLLCSMAIVLVRLGVIGRGVPALGRWGMWAIMAIFLLNTVGNLFALDLRETLIFTPVTLLAALLAWRVALGGQASTW